MHSAMKKIKTIIYGKVQGVGFRFFIQKSAQKYGIKGWVRNIDNDKVEIVCLGEQKEMDKLLKNIKKGPEGARIKKIETMQTDEQIISDKFTIKPSV